MTSYTEKQIDIRIYAVGVSLLASLFTILLPDTLNDDAYTYIKTAEIFLADGVAQAYQHYAWAGYSILMALVSKFGFSLVTSAFVINALFYALLVYSFISIVMQINDSRQVLFFAAICILLYPQLNEYRYLIIRDVGFWALALFALWQFLLYTNEQSLKHAIIFSASLVIAASFRAEAIVYLLLIPFAVLFDYRFEKSQCQKKFLVLAGIVVASLIIALLVLAMAGMSFAHLLTDFLLRYEPFVYTAFSPSAAESSELGRALFGEHAATYSQEYIFLFLAAGLLVILAANLFNGVGGPFFWLLVYGLYKKYARVDRHILVPVLFTLAISSLILFVFLYVTRYLSSRYAMLFCLLVALIIPIIVSRIVDSINARAWGSLGQRIIILFFGYLGFDSFISFGDSKDFVFETVAWIDLMPQSDIEVLTNNHAIAYYSGRVKDYDLIQRFLTESEIVTAKPDALIAVEMHYEMSELLSRETIGKLIEFQTAFPSIDDQRVAIYRRIGP
ncbi:MAG: hypothetical protein O2971_00300 [Proteobacteria bacterium]|nr:hypothetical protein [Pseudomonadota bacterium]